MLNAGSSRVFNCNDVARKLERRDGEQAPYLFRTPAMHHLVLVKEAMRYDDPRHPKGVAIGSKIYVPYNHDEIYEGGGRSFSTAPICCRFSTSSSASSEPRRARRRSITT